MMLKLNDDVDFALDEYNAAIRLESQAKRIWDRRVMLEKNRPVRPTADETLLLRQTVEYFRKRFKDRMKTRIKKKETYDKRLSAKEKHKTETDVVDRKENWVYTEGSNFNIRWSALPR